MSPRRSLMLVVLFLRSWEGFEEKNDGDCELSTRLVSFRPSSCSIVWWEGGDDDDLTRFWYLRPPPKRGRSSYMGRHDKLILLTNADLPIGWCVSFGRKPRWSGPMCEVIISSPVAETLIWTAFSKKHISDIHATMSRYSRPQTHREPKNDQNDGDIIRGILVSWISPTTV